MTHSLANQLINNMLLDILFPNRCLECDEIIKNKEIICLKCLEKINFTHWDFGDNPLKQKAKFLFPIENAYALMHFEKSSLSQKIIHQLKYKNQEIIGKILAEWICERINLNTIIEKPNLIVSVPLHPKKLKERGYNQLHLFTETLSKHLNIPYQHNFLKRNTYNKAQASKNKNNRENTLYDFSLTENIENKHILVVDDVFTTGNTLNAIAWEILKYKGNKISILVIAMD